MLATNDSLIPCVQRFLKEGTTQNVPLLILFLQGRALLRGEV